MLRKAADTVARDPVILVADDDPLFRESLTGNLASRGYRVEGFSDGSDLLDWFGAGQSGDLILLDWKMPQVNGIEVLRRLRANDNGIPVIFLTVLSDQFYEEAALHGGAMDFVEKSRSFAILQKRIELILNGPKHGNGGGGPEIDMSGDLTIGPLDLSADAKRARWRDTEVGLSFTEFRIVHAMASQAGTDLSYREIYDMVHGKGFVAGMGPDGYRSNVRTFIKRIRQKFREIDDGFDAIENYPGYGYRWRGAGGRRS